MNFKVTSSRTSICANYYFNIMTNQNSFNLNFYILAGTLSYLQNYWWLNLIIILIQQMIKAFGCNMDDTQITSHYITKTINWDINKSHEDAYEFKDPSKCYTQTDHEFSIYQM